MTDKPRRKWADIQVDLFQDAARRHENPESAERFEALLTRLLPPIEPRESVPARRDAPRAAAGKPRDPG